MTLVRLGVAIAVVVMGAACGAERETDCVAGKTDLSSDPLNCGSCGNACGANFACIDYRCLEGLCQPGAVEECYEGTEGTLDIGPCVKGVRTCGPVGAWSRCEGQVIPVAEHCGDGIDNNCNGVADEDMDLDGDGFTTCGAPGVPPDCCDSTECTKPKQVNGGAFDSMGNGIDDDCNGVIDDAVTICDQNLSSNTTVGMDFAKAIDLCQTTTDTEKKWGVLETKVTLADGTGVPDKEGYSIRPRFGTGVLPQGGVNLVLISSGGAAAKGDVNPSYHHWVSYTHVAGTSTSALPADWYAANNYMLPNAPGCPAATSGTANDPVMITYRIRVPTNAQSFKLSTFFYSAEFPEWTCTVYNDFFVVLLDSAYNGTQPNPMDKNLAFYQPMGTTQKVPVGVNLAYGNTGLFTVCVNGTTGCSGGNGGQITTCTGTTMMENTGFDDPQANQCDGNSLMGGGTGWLVTAGNVQPGEIMTLRVAIWDTTDTAWDSLAVLDGFQWSTDLASPGTVIFKGNAPQ